ncbi:ABC-2 type transport system permease protein [Fodinibius roseus]|uniref:ABC-2 type transport system permease protein n=1 Tax=Fodinibius roseus TaxID=1194090 RepID=A0A1M5D5C3_9BACT|nr:ABC transporter permease [Fodinibius roseus]SHF62188.1 ABC-2 type transport system permease protein [Fodinibius roseus]
MNFQQILLVLKREYVTRLRSRGFIIATILIPLGMIAFVGAGIGIAVWDTGSEHTIGIVDQTNSLYPRLEELAGERYKDFSATTEDSLRHMVASEQLDGYILLTEAHVTLQEDPEYVSSGAGGISLQSRIRSDLRQVIRDERISRASVSEEVQQIFEADISLSTTKLTEQGEATEDDTGFLTIVGLVMGIIIFGSVLGYGGMLTRSVIEEKTNRIIEVITSSVRPIELLLGKMGGVGALALSQLVFWLASFFALAAAAGPLAGMMLGPEMVPGGEAAAGNFNPDSFAMPDIAPSLILYFLLFFILGYLLYSSLFAAIGSAVDSETDTQQFMFPVMIPVMIGYFIMFRAMENPDSTLAVAGSLVPFCTPIVMITRIAITDVPFWQIWLSILLMIATFALTMWLSAKIYSVGILSYGQSAGFKELWKWVRE